MEFPEPDIKYVIQVDINGSCYFILGEYKLRYKDKDGVLRDTPINTSAFKSTPVGFWIDSQGFYIENSTHIIVKYRPFDYVEYMRD